MIPKQLVLVLRMTSLCYVSMRVLRGYDARKNQKTFVFSLAYSYLCRRYGFWLRKGYEGLTFFGTILTPSQEEADRFNNSHDPMKNHEMIHLRQAQATGDSWLRFYLLYIWYWFFLSCFCGLAVRRQLRNAAYLLNPFEMEAYDRMNDPDYLAQCKDGATEWRKYARMSVKERLRRYQEIRQQLKRDKR